MNAGTAYHEAGHAVIGVDQGFGLRSVALMPEDEEVGGTAFFGPLPKWFNDYEPDNRTHLYVEKRIMMAWAGTVAEEMHGQSSREERDIGFGIYRESSGRSGDALALDGSDVSNIMKFATVVTGGETKELSALMNWLRIRTENRLRHPRVWPQVESLAASLLEHRKLSGKQARVIMQEAALKVMWGGRTPPKLEVRRNLNVHST